MWGAFPRGQSPLSDSPGCVRRLLKDSDTLDQVIHVSTCVSCMTACAWAMGRACRVVARSLQARLVACAADHVEFCPVCACVRLECTQPGAQMPVIFHLMISSRAVCPAPSTPQPPAAAPATPTAATPMSSTAGAALGAFSPATLGAFSPAASQITPSSPAPGTCPHCPGHVRCEHTQTHTHTSACLRLSRNRRVHTLARVCT